MAIQIALDHAPSKALAARRQVAVNALVADLPSVGPEFISVWNVAGQVADTARGASALRVT
jgi:hypothetical protein